MEWIIKDVTEKMVLTDEPLKILAHVMSLGTPIKNNVLLN